MVALGEAGRVVGSVGIEAGSEFEIPVLLVEICGDRFAPRNVFVDLCECRQPCAGAVRFTDSDGTVEPDDGSVGEPQQLVVPLDDLDPVGVVDPRRIGVERGDRRLRLVFAEPVACERRLHDGDSLGDQFVVPQAPVLARERHDSSVWLGAAAPACVVQQHKSEQPVSLRVVCRPRQLPGQSDCLRRQVDVARVALVEDEVQHSHHRSHIAKSIETRPPDRALGATDALCHGALRHEVGLCDLTRGEAAHGPKGQSHRR